MSENKNDSGEETALTRTADASLQRLDANIQVTERTLARREEARDAVPMLGGNPGRTGLHPGPGPDVTGREPEVKWRFEAEGEVESSPAVRYGTVYIGSTDGFIYALDKETGALHWRFDTGDEVTSSPAVVEGIVYAETTGKYKLFALDAHTGDVKWSFEDGGDVWRSSPAVCDGKVFVRAGTVPSRCLNLIYALDVETGSVEWSFTNNDVIDSDPAASNGTVYFGSLDHHIYAVDARTGDLKWKRNCGGEIVTPPTVSEGVVYASSFTFRDQPRSYGTVHALDPKTGELLWDFETDRRMESIIGVSADTVYVADNNDNTLYAIDKETCTERWRVKIRISSSPVISGETVYFGTDDHYLYALDAEDGSVQWQFKADGQIYSTPAVLDGSVYFGTVFGSSSDGSCVYALQ